MVGIGGYRCSQDEALFQAFRGSTSKPISIIDCRPRENALANQVTGGGFERDYEACSIFFMNVENIHEVRASYERLFDLVNQ